MSRETYRLPTRIRETLERSGRPWSVESRRRHALLIVNGSAVAVLPRGSARERLTPAYRNALAAVRRALRSSRDGDES